MKILLWLVLGVASYAQMPLGGITGPGSTSSCPSLPSPAPISFWIISGDTSGGSGCSSPTNSTTVYDLTGSANTGTWSGTAAGGVASTYYSAATGRTATPYAGNFNGTNNYISYSAPVLNNPISLSAWVKPVSMTDPGGIVELRNASLNGIIMYLNINGGTAHAFACYENNRGTALGTVNLQDGSWHFIACTYDGTTVRGYVDGSAVGTASGGSDGGIPSGSPRFIGKTADASPLFFSGLINMVGVWNVTVTSGQITTMFSTQAFNVIPELRPLSRPYFSAEAITERQQFYGRKLAA